MAKIPVSEPAPRVQPGQGMPVTARIEEALPGASPLFQLSWLHEIFRYRNQEYGAYDLRQRYYNNMMWGGIWSIGLLLALYGSTLLASVLQEKLELMTEYNSTDLLPPPPKEEKAPPPPVVAPPPPARATIAFVVPRVDQDEDVPEEYEPPTQEDLADKNPGTITTNGDPNGVDYLPDEPVMDAPPPAVVLEEEPEAGPTKSSIFVLVEQMPAFRGNLHQFLAQEIQYPRIAVDNGIEGTVVVQFVVNEEGMITNPQVVRDIGGGCGEEALRVVKKMPPWLPGANRGRPVKVQMNLPIRFKLE